jgi:hypothetical protein
LAKPIAYILDNIPWAPPVLLFVVSVIFASERPTLLNMTGMLFGVGWLVRALGRGPREKREHREGGLTPAMTLAMKRALADKENSGSASNAKSAAPALAADPLIKAKIGGKEIFDRVVNGVKDERGVHMETLLAYLGGLAGYACQFCVRERRIKYGAKSVDSGFTIVTGADGRKYYFGAALNEPLVEGRYSVWSLTAGAVAQLGKPLPDLRDIVKHSAATVGGARFGIPRMPEGHGLGGPPLDYLKAVWPKILPIAQRFCDDPVQLPIVFGIAVQNAIIMAKDVLDPTLAGAIAMECAVSMSKVDLG